MRHCVSRWATTALFLAVMTVRPADNSLAASDRESSATGLKSQLRRPVAMAFVRDGRQLCVANRDSGSLSIIDTDRLLVVEEITIGTRLSDLAVLPDSRRLLTVDEAEHQLLLLEGRDSGWDVISRQAVGQFPVSVQVTADGTRCFVASLWSRQISIIDITTDASGDEQSKLTMSRSILLPFAPRKQLLVHGDTKLVVADSFGGRLAVIDSQSGELESVRSLPAHNVRGLASSSDGKRVYLTHQVLSPLAHTIESDIHWGVLMTNNVRSLSLNTILDPQANLLDGSQLYQLGDVGNGAADPADLAVGGPQKVFVAFSGVDEVGSYTSRFGTFGRVRVGRRPTAVLVSPDRDRLFVANTFSDSVSVVDTIKHEIEVEISLGPHPEMSLAERGESLFYDARLSHDGWLSCHSCHTDGHTNELLNDNLSDGSFDSPKRVLSLLGVGDTHPWAWNGGATKLEGQIRNSTQKTMRGKPLSDDRVAELALFLRSLKPAPSLTRSRDRVDEDALNRGRVLFQSRGCVRCHAPPTYTSPQSYDMKLSEDNKDALFNPPSLRGLSQRDAFFHNNNGHTLKDVLQQHPPQTSENLSSKERADLIDFLRSL